VRNMLFGLAFGLSTAAAGPIVIGPIPMNGGGTYSWEFGISGGFSEIFGAFGTDGTDTVSMSINDGTDHSLPTPFPGFPNTLSGGGFCISGPSLVVDGISCLPSQGDFGSWSIGGGAGFIMITDSLHNPLAAATLISYLQYTSASYMFDASGNIRAATATFDIIPIPEAQSSEYAGLSLGLFVLVYWRMFGDKGQLTAPGPRIAA
jgi:hypothetical protein